MNDQSKKEEKRWDIQGFPFCTRAFTLYWDHKQSWSLKGIQLTDGLICLHIYVAWQEKIIQTLSYRTNLRSRELFCINSWVEMGSSRWNRTNKIQTMLNFFTSFYPWLWLQDGYKIELWLGLKSRAEQSNWEELELQVPDIPFWFLLERNWHSSVNFI